MKVEVRRVKASVLVALAALGFWAAPVQAQGLSFPCNERGKVVQTIPPASVGVAGACRGGAPLLQMMAGAFRRAAAERGAVLEVVAVESWLLVDRRPEAAWALYVSAFNSLLERGWVPSQVPTKGISHTWDTPIYPGVGIITWLYPASDGTYLLVWYVAWR